VVEARPVFVWVFLLLVHQHAYCSRCARAATDLAAPERRAKVPPERRERAASSATS